MAVLRTRPQFKDGHFIALNAFNCAMQLRISKNILHTAL